MSQILPHISEEHRNFYLEWFLPQYLRYLNSKSWSLPPLTFLQLIGNSSVVPLQLEMNGTISSSSLQTSNSNEIMDDGINSQLDDLLSDNLGHIFSPQGLPSTDIAPGSAEQDLADISPEPSPLLPLPVPKLIPALVAFGLFAYLPSAMEMILCNPLLSITLLLLSWICLAILAIEVCLRPVIMDGI
jgi:hypothetical protein